MAYLTELKLANTFDVPVNLPTTEIKMGDWLVIGTLKIIAPMRLTYRMLNFNFSSTSLDLTKIQPVNLVAPNFGFCYIGLFFNYISGDPSGFTALDIVKSSALGVVTRNARPLISATEGTYSWLAVNNIQFSDQNALLSATDSADFKLSCTGQCRVELDLTQ